MSLPRCALGFCFGRQSYNKPEQGTQGAGQVEAAGAQLLRKQRRRSDPAERQGVCGNGHADICKSEAGQNQVTLNVSADRNRYFLSCFCLLLGACQLQTKE